MPLLFDMPYEDLLTYEGTNPKPADFEVLLGCRPGRNERPRPTG